MKRFSIVSHGIKKVPTSYHNPHKSRDVLYLNHAGVAKLVDAPVLGTGGAIHGGSSPLPGTDMYPIK